MISKPRGTVDYPPEEMLKRKEVENRLRTIFENYGYEEVQTPIFEKLELFTMKSGEGIVNELYNFKDKGGRDLTLVPERTASIARFYANELKNRRRPLKLYYISQCFRYEEPQKARYREFWQFGCELIGARLPEAQAEVISLAYHSLKETKLKKFELKIGNLDILNLEFERLGLEERRKLLYLIDKGRVDELDSERLKEILSIKTMDELKEHGLGDEKFFKILEALNEFGVEYEIDLKVVRGLDYYKGVVFEIKSRSLGAEDQIAGGGSYKLLPLLEVEDMETSGFAIGFDRVVEALKSEDYEFRHREKFKAYILPLSEEEKLIGCRLLARLRTNNIKAEMDWMGRRLKDNLNYASDLAETAIIIGKRELESGNIIIRELDAKSQIEIPINEVLKYYSKRGGKQR